MGLSTASMAVHGDSLHVDKHFSGGSYAGNGSSNRAIPHGLGVIPKLVMLQVDEGGGLDCQTIILPPRNRLMGYEYSSNVHVFDVTVADTINFYVGQNAASSSAGNSTPITYYWLAIA